MPVVRVGTTSGSAIEFMIPEPARNESCFFVGMQKGGSTMLAKVAKALAKENDTAFYSLPNELWRKGIKFDHLTADINDLFLRKGYCFAGFKGLIDPIHLPPSASRRTIFLVRDPRDMLTSQYFSVAISHPPPGSSFSADRKRAFDAKRARTRDMSIDDYVLKMSSNVAKSFERTLSKLSAIDHKMYNYENVVFKKTSWINDIANYLDLDIRADTVEEIVRQVNVVPQEENTAKHIRKVTPGDHKDKLQPATIDKLNKTFAEIFRTLGYL